MKTQISLMSSLAVQAHMSTIKDINRLSLRWLKGSRSMRNNILWSDKSKMELFRSSIQASWLEESRLLSSPVHQHHLQ